MAEDEGEQSLSSFAFADAKARTKFVAKFCTKRTDPMTKPLPPNGDRGFVAEDEGFAPFTLSCVLVLRLFALTRAGFSSNS